MRDVRMNGPIFSSREMITRLVAFDTSSHQSNIPLIDFVSEYLAAHGVNLERIPSPDGRKANLYASLGPREPGAIVLSGHTDVVTAEGQSWLTDPWALTDIDGRLHGRGTADMKSFLAVALALVPEFRARGLSRPLHFALSYDEEVGCVGVRSLIAHMKARVDRPSLVIVGEPTGMQVVAAHKGNCAFSTTVVGHEVHSSQIHDGVNAIAVAAELIAFLRGLAEEQARIGDSSGLFDPPYTSIHVGMIDCEPARAAAQGSCRFQWEVRPLPDAEGGAVVNRFHAFIQETVLPRISAISRQSDIVVEERHDVPSFRAGHNSPAVQLALKLSGQRETKVWSVHTEAGLFEAAGFPTAICGPGELAQAHQANEFITAPLIDACELFFRRLMDEICLD